MRKVPVFLLVLFLIACDSVTESQPVVPTATAVSPIPTPLSTTMTSTELVDVAVSTPLPTSQPTPTVSETMPAEPTPSHVARAFIIWQHSDESGRCRQARIGREWLAVRACDDANPTIYPLSSERQSELLQFSSTFTSFEANTNAGRIEFNGSSGFYAAPAEARQIATWAALVVQEAESGQTLPTLLLTWQRQQGGQCQKLHTTLLGLATAFSCNNDVDVALAQQKLMPEKLGQLYDWYDRLGIVQGDHFSFYGQGGARLDETDKRAIERFAESLFTVMQVSITADTGIDVEPLVQAADIRFGSWSPDSRWFAFWQSTADDLEQQLPTGTLHFANMETDQTCSMPAFYGETYASRLAWTEDNQAIVYLEEVAFIGHPCQPDSFIPYDSESVTQTTPTPDPNLSPDGHYRIQTDVLAETDNFVSLRTTMINVASGQPLHTVEWRSQSYLDGCCGAEWVSSSHYLINETLERPLLIDAELGVLDVPLDIFGVQPLPAPPDGALTLYYAFALPSSERDQFHLLLGLRGNFSDAFPAMLLYHAERDLVEMLPAGWNVWNLSATSKLLYLTEEVITGNPLPDGRRNTGYNLWTRHLEEVESAWQLTAPAMDSFFWREDQSEIAFIQNESRVIWQTFPEGKLLGRWRTDPYWVQVISYSPNGRYLVTAGNVPSLPDYALFVHERGTNLD